MKALTVTSFFLNIFFALMLVTAPLFAGIPMSALTVAPGQSYEPMASLELMRMDLNYEVASEMFRDEIDLYGGEAFDVIYGIPYIYYSLSSLAFEEDAMMVSDTSLIPLAYTRSYHEPLIADLVAA